MPVSTCTISIRTLSIDDEMRRRRRPEVKFSRANLLGMRKVVKKSSTLYRRKMSTHALEKMTRDLFRAMSLAPRQKCPGNVVEMKGAMAAFSAVTALQFLATVRDQKLFWSEF